MDFVALLPGDIVLNHIINLLDFTSRVRGATMSRTWRDLIRAAPRISAHSSLPWLWCALDHNGNPSLLDISFSTFIRSGRCPSQDHQVIGSHGLYLTFTDLSCTLTKPIRIFSPFTSESCQLPCTYSDFNGLTQQLENIQAIHFSSRLPNCVIAAESSQSNTVYLCRPGDKNWVEMLMAPPCKENMIFHKGGLYCLQLDRIIEYNFTYMVDCRNGRTPPSSARGTWIKRSVIIDNSSLAGGGYFGNLLVESDGELLAVISFHDSVRKIMGFRVYRVDKENGWLVLVKDLGDKRLFINDHGCLIMPQPGFLNGSMTPFDSFFTKNSIYFFTAMSPDAHQSPPHYLLGRFQLDSETCTYHPKYVFKDQPIWVIPPNQNI